MLSALLIGMIVKNTKFILGELFQLTKGETQIRPGVSRLLVHSLLLAH